MRLSLGVRELALVLSLACPSFAAQALDSAQAAVSNAPAAQPLAGTVEVLFSPWNDIEGAILNALRNAKKTIYVQAFSFTSRELARGLIEAHKRGVKVMILADHEQTVKMDNSQIPALVKAGIPVALEMRYASAHNKIMLIDADESEGLTQGLTQGLNRGSNQGLVITGSYNFTYSAKARNAENIVILRSNPTVLQTYLYNWKRHHADALPYVEAALIPPKSRQGKSRAFSRKFE